MKAAMLNSERFAILQPDKPRLQRDRAPIRVFRQLSAQHDESIIMEEVVMPGFILSGIQLKGKTTNEGGQSSIDCGGLWQEFMSRNIADRIPHKISDDIYAVYFDYEGDHTKPYSFFIGCRVTDSKVPPDLQTLSIPQQRCRKIVTAGKMPDCVAGAWREIWRSDIPRVYQYDLEEYGPESQDWNNAVVNIFLSVR